VNDAALDAAKRLAAAGIDSARLDARLMWEHAQTLFSPVHGGSGAQSAPEGADAAAIFEKLIQRRLNREPVAAIIGSKEFWSLDFDVGPGVLIPRPDTETLIEQALALYPDRNAPLRIADLGTGSGAILVAALTEYPNATGIGFESSPDAQPYAARNAARHVGSRADIRLADWNAAAQEANTAPFDLVFSNPPYIPAADIESLQPEVRLHEPRAALNGGPDGLDAYRALGRLLPGILAPGGHALLEIGAGQAAAMERLFQGLELLRINHDLSGIPRCVVLKAGKSLGNQGPIR
jgi:release factor glutamine methyltransferase